MKFNKRVSDWEMKQFGADQIKKIKRSYDEAPPEPKDTEKSKVTERYIKQLAKMDPEFRRTITKTKAPEKLIGKSNLMKAHAVESFDSGRIAKDKSKFSVLTQIDKLDSLKKGKPAIASKAEILESIAKKDKAQSENRVKTQMTKQRQIERVVRTEDFIESAQKRANSTFESVSISEKPNLKKDRDSRRSRMQDKRSEKDDFKIEKPKNLSEAGSTVNKLKEAMKKKGLM